MVGYLHELKFYWNSVILVVSQCSWSNVSYITIYF